MDADEIRRQRGIAAVATRLSSARDEIQRADMGLSSIGREDLMGELRAMWKRLREIRDLIEDESKE